MSRTSANFAFSGPAMSANFPSKLVFGLSGEGGSDGGEVRELVHEATTEEVSCVFVYTGFGVPVYHVLKELSGIYVTAV